MNHCVELIMNILSFMTLDAVCCIYTINVLWTECAILSGHCHFNSRDRLIS